MPKPLCVSNKPSPARLPLVCLVSPSARVSRQLPLPPGTRFASRPPQAGAAGGSPRHPQRPFGRFPPLPALPRALGVPGEPRPSAERLCRRGVGVLAAPAAPWGALSSLTLQWGVPPAWCQPTEPQIPSPSPLCRSPPPSSLLHPTQGGWSPKGASSVIRGQPWGVIGVGTSPLRSGRAGTGESSAILALASGHGEGCSPPHPACPPQPPARVST